MSVSILLLSFTATIKFIRLGVEYLYMTVNVIISEKLSRKPIPFISVRIESGSDSYSDDTNIRGIAEFHGIPDGKYNIKIRHKDYRPYTEKMFISRNSIINIKLHKAFD